MKHPPPLFLGLGGFGGEVLRKLGSGNAPCQRIWIDQRAEILFAGGCGFGCRGGCGGTAIPALGLAGEEAREALLRLPDWQQYFSWLPDGREARWLSELGSYSTSGYRVLGRMSFTRSHRVLDAGLRKSARGAAGILPPREVFLIASLDGGTGSAILADVTLLLRRLLPRAVLHALLLVPPKVATDRRRFEAGAFATLLEISELYRSHPLKLSLEGETADLLRDPLVELWQRIFLFRTAELPPYQGAAKEIAEVLALLADPEISAIRSHWPEARLDSELARWHPFSTVSGFHGGFPFPPTWTIEQQELSAALPPSEEVAAGPMVEKNPTTAVHAGGEPNRKQLEDDLDQLYEAFRSLRAEEQTLAHQRLREIEIEILALPRSTFQSPRGAAVTKNATPLDQHIDDLVTLHKNFDRRESYKLKGHLQRRLGWRPPIWRNFEFEQRVNIARKILEWVPYLPASPMTVQVHSTGGAVSQPAPKHPRQLFQPPPPALLIFEDFLTRLEASRQTPVFCSNNPEESRRLRAALLVPPEIEDPEPWASALRHHLGVEPEVHRCRSGPLRLWWEDLYHPLESIEGIQALASAYLATPERPLLHTDRAFQPKAEAWAEAHRS